MIERVYAQAKKCSLLSRVIIATDDERIAQAVASFGGEVAMTRDDHESGTDRLAEVAERMPELDVIVNIQGDEPLIDPQAVDSAIAPLLEPGVEMATAAWSIERPEEVASSQVVKVVIDRMSNALYFSRRPIPYHRDADDLSNGRYLGHLGLYVYTRACLLRISKLAPTPLEMAERLEQLRALENGIKIRVVKFKSRALAVDVPEDVEKVELALKL
jgi:3-deoxy-manno-octulosonate cytidylyltransferase (CMP-KDO synthetase)